MITFQSVFCHCRQFWITGCVRNALSSMSQQFCPYLGCHIFTKDWIRLRYIVKTSQWWQTHCSCAGERQVYPEMYHHIFKTAASHVARIWPLKFRGKKKRIALARAVILILQYVLELFFLYKLLLSPLNHTSTPVERKKALTLGRRDEKIQAAQLVYLPSQDQPFLCV